MPINTRNTRDIPTQAKLTAAGRYYLRSGGYHCWYLSLYTWYRAVLVGIVFYLYLFIDVYISVNIITVYLSYYLRCDTLTIERSKWKTCRVISRYLITVIYFNKALWECALQNMKLNKQLNKYVRAWRSFVKKQAKEKYFTQHLEKSYRCLIFREKWQRHAVPEIEASMATNRPSSYLAKLGTGRAVSATPYSALDGLRSNFQSEVDWHPLLLRLKQFLHTGKGKLLRYTFSHMSIYIIFLRIFIICLFVFYIIRNNRKSTTAKNSNKNKIPIITVIIPPQLQHITTLHRSWK